MSAFIGGEGTMDEPAVAVEEVAVFPGIQLSFRDYKGEKCCLRHHAEEGVMHIHHSKDGRMGWKMNDGMTYYLGPGDLLLHMSDCCAGSEMNFPLGYHRGLSIAIDLDILTRETPEILKEAGIDGSQLYRKFFPEGRPVAMAASDKIEHIFSELYDLPDQVRLPYFKLKVQELILFLSMMEMPKNREMGLQPSAQADVIREIHHLLVTHLDQRFTIEALSKRYLINTCTLKTVFKAVYGMPIASYMKAYRVKEAARLLRETGDSIAVIAGKVGYENQSKFTKAFKDIYHVLPTEYRKGTSGR